MGACVFKTKLAQKHSFCSSARGSLTLRNYQFDLNLTHSAPADLILTKCHAWVHVFLQLNWLKSIVSAVQLEVALCVSDLSSAVEILFAVA